MVAKPNLQIKSKNFRKIKIKKQPDKRQVSVSSQILVKRIVHHPRIVPYPYRQLILYRARSLYTYYCLTGIRFLLKRYHRPKEVSTFMDYEHQIVQWAALNTDADYSALD